MREVGESHRLPQHLPYPAMLWQRPVGDESAEACSLPGPHHPKYTLNADRPSAKICKKVPLCAGFQTFGVSANEMAQDLMANHHQRQGHRNNHWQRFNNRERTLTQDSSASSFASVSSSHYPHQSKQNSQSWSEPDGNSFKPPSPKMGQEFRQIPTPNSTAGQKDLEVLEKLKESIINNQHEFFRSVPQPAALEKIYMGNASISPVPPHPEQIPVAQNEARKDIPSDGNQRRGHAPSNDSYESRKQVLSP